MTHAKNFRRWVWALGIAGVVAAAFAAGMLAPRFLRPPTAAEMVSARFTDADRLRYRAALEKLRYELRSAPGSPPFEQAVTEDMLRAGMAEDGKKAGLLSDRCGVEITDAMLSEEYERLKADPGDTRVLAAIVGALDNDPAAVIEFWMRPVLVDRYLRACVSADEGLNAGARAKAEGLWRSAAPQAAVVTVGLGDAGLAPEDREVLTGAAVGRTAVVESPDDFHFFIIHSRSGDTIEARLVSIPKPGFEDWLKSQP